MREGKWARRQEQVWTREHAVLASRVRWGTGSVLLQGAHRRRSKAVREQQRVCIQHGHVRGIDDFALDCAEMAAAPRDVRPDAKHHLSLSVVDEHAPFACSLCSIDDIHATPAAARQM